MNCERELVILTLEVFRIDITLTIWDWRLELIKSQPLLGVGVGNYVPALQQRYQLEPWQYQPAHNIFIFIGAELGLIGLILFLAILFIIVYRLKNISLDPLSITLIGLGFVFLFMGQLDHYFVTIQQGRLMFVTILGLLAALPNIYIYDHQKNS
jgi:O-antigen ligase